MGDRRNGRTRRERLNADNLKAQRRQPCMRCGMPIDYTLPPDDPMAFVAGHIKSWINNPELRAEPSNLQQEHAKCGKSAHDDEDGGRGAMGTTVEAVVSRLVVLLCGPPGAGKTTIARESGLTVYDRDDPEWSGEAQFRAKLSDLKRDGDARAVVIRAGASSSARRKAADLVGATHVYLIGDGLTADDLRHRVAHRNRADKRNGLAAIKTWLSQYDRADNVKPFPGWNRVLNGPQGATSRVW